MDNIAEILTQLGYNLKDYGQEYRARPVYRSSNNETVLRIRKDSGYWVDFKEGKGGPLRRLVKLTLGLGSDEEGSKWLKEKGFNKIQRTRTKPVLKGPKTFSLNELSKIDPDYSYWRNRGITSTTVLRDLGSGVVRSTGKMSNRYVFPVQNAKKQIVGFSGRDISGKSKIKWKHLGNKQDWRYPAQINFKNIIKSKTVILVESIGDMLSLWDIGVKETVVTFGLDISLSVLNFLIRIDPDRILISFNNDSENNNAGNVAAQKAEKKLSKWFDRRQIEIQLPPEGDFNDMLINDRERLIKEWKEPVYGKKN
jgi:hypothetical protein